MLIKYLIKCSGQVFILAFILFFFQQIAFAQTIEGSCIVIFREESKIIVAADSKFSGGEKPFNGCKIYKFGDVFFVGAGIHSDSASGFSIVEFAEKACSSKGTVQEKADRYIELSKESLVNALTRIRANEPEFFKKKYPSNSHTAPSQLVFFGFENGQVSMSVRQFRLTSGDSEKVGFVVDKIDCPSANCAKSGQSTAIFLGHNESIDQLWPPNVQPKHTIETAKEIINAEIVNHPDSVGLPIAILQVDSNGITWIENGECQ
jgi:hypothetical protein